MDDKETDSDEPHDVVRIIEMNGFRRLSVGL